MAGRVVNRRALRESGAASKRRERFRNEEPARKRLRPAGGPDEVEAPPRRRKVRLKAYWAVMSQNLTEVATYEYAQQEEARRRAAELTESKRIPHFVRVVKKPLGTTGERLEKV